MAVNASRRTPRLSVVVPTLGLSPWLVPCLEALRRDGGGEIEILLVAQGGAAGDEAAGRLAAAEALADRTFRRPSNAGFAVANNTAMAAAGGSCLATVNDDAIVDDGWCQGLLQALEDDPGLAAVQGIQLNLEDPALVDGAGLAWNRAWQAVQIGHGGPLAAMPGAPVEIYGVSSTAAVYRREALDKVAGGDFAVFEPRLVSYYEDVDLAGRLRGAGYRALLVPAVRARHAGSVSGKLLPGAGRSLIYGNRHLVLARLLGRAFWPRWPWIALRDLADLARAGLAGDAAAVAGIAAGAGRALRRLPGFARRGAPLVPLAEIRRFRVGGGEAPWR